MAEAEKKKLPESGAGVATQPRTSTVLRWSPDQITRAELRAAAGDFAMMGELCETMMCDDRVKQALDRLFSATTLPLSFQLPGVDSEQSKDDPICQALDADWWKMWPEGTVREIVSWVALANVALVHIDEWKLMAAVEGGRLISKATVWSLRHLRDDPERGLMVRVASPGSAWGTEEIPLDDGNGSWILFVSGSSLRNAIMTASWRGISRWWLLKAYATVDWASSSERHGQGTTVVWNENEEIVYTKEQREKLGKQIDEGGRTKTIVLPDGYKADLLFDTANTWSTFKAQTEMANLAISLSLVGTNLTTEVKGGSLAAAKVHENVDESKFRSLLETLATGFHDKHLPWWAGLNFPSGAVPYPHWDTTPPEDLDALANTHAKASIAVRQWREAGVNVSKKWVVSKWGVVLAESQDDELAPMPAKDAPEQLGQSPKEKPQKNARALAAAKAEPLPAFEVGRAYADDLEEHIATLAAKGIMPTLAAVIEAISGAESYEDAKQRLFAAYERVKPIDASDTERALIMAQMAGRETVEQEITEE